MESLCYTAETGTILYINCTLIKKKKKKKEGKRKIIQPKRAKTENF